MSKYSKRYKDSDVLLSLRLYGPIFHSHMNNRIDELRSKQVGKNEYNKRSGSINYYGDHFRIKMFIGKEETTSIVCKLIPLKSARRCHFYDWEIIIYSNNNILRKCNMDYLREEWLDHNLFYQYWENKAITIVEIQLLLLTTVVVKRKTTLVVARLIAIFVFGNRKYFNSTIIDTLDMFVFGTKSIL